MDNKILGVLALGGLTLTSCTLVGNPVHKDVTGQLRGFKAQPNLGLAIVGYNGGKYTADGTESQLIDKFLTGGFVLDLPANLPYGSYRVVVFRDANKNHRYDVGDTILSKDNGKLLIYTSYAGEFLTGTAQGWNIYNVNTGTIQSKLLSDYDLQAQ